MSLVFASGFLIPQKFRSFEYFRGIGKRYPNALFPRVDVAANVETRANQLAEQIEKAFPAGRIDIVAHSMGGLDARFLLSNNLRGLAGRVATLSTISTPHRGSPLADLLAGPTTLGSQRLVYDLVRDTMARLGFAIGGLANLTTGAAMTIDQRCPDVPHVSYFAYAGCGPCSYALGLGGWLITKAGSTPDERQNDGLVSVASAQWPGSQLTEPAWPADHMAEVGYDLDHPKSHPRFDHLAAIERVVERALASPSTTQTRELSLGAP